METVHNCQERDNREGTQRGSRANAMWQKGKGRTAKREGISLPSAMSMNKIVTVDLQVLQGAKLSQLWRNTPCQEVAPEIAARAHTLSDYGGAPECGVAHTESIGQLNTLKGLDVGKGP
jgi:hypothetical protein